MCRAANPPQMLWTSKFSAVNFKNWKEILCFRLLLAKRYQHSQSPACSVWALELPLFFIKSHRKSFLCLGLGRKWIPLYSAFFTPTWSTASSCGVPSIRRTWMPWSRSRGGPWRWPEGWSISKNQALNQKLNQKLRPTSANLSSELNKQPELLDTTDRFKAGLGDWMTKSLLYPRSLAVSDMWARFKGWGAWETGMAWSQGEKLEHEKRLYHAFPI